MAQGAKYNPVEAEMHGDWIKLHRSALDSAAFKDPALWKVWTWCLLRASYRKRNVPIQTGRGNGVVALRAGQFIFGRKKSSNELNMAPSSVRNRMARLKKLGNVDIVADRHYSIVTVSNWDIYQKGAASDGQVSGQAKDRQRTGKGHKQEVKKGRREERNTYSEGFAKFWDAYPRRRRQAKRQCWEKWQAKGLQARADEVLGVLEAYKRTDEWTKANGQFVPTPHKWLHREYYETDPADLVDAYGALGLTRPRDPSAADLQAAFGPEWGPADE